MGRNRGKKTSTVKVDDKFLEQQRNDDLTIQKEKQLVEKLKSKGLVRKEIPKDGACLFRAVSEQIFGSQEYHYYIRQKVVDTLVEEKERFINFVEGIPYDHYLFQMRKYDTWGGEIELHAISSCFLVNIEIYSADLEYKIPEDPFPSNKKIQLCFSNGNHYDCVYTNSTWEKMEFSQNFIYKLLEKTIPSLKFTAPGSYKNVGLNVYKLGLTSRQTRDYNLAKDLQNELSGAYMKSNTAEFQIIKGKNKKNSKGNQKVKQIISIPANISFDRKEDNDFENFADFEDSQPNGAYSNDYFFPSLNAPDPKTAQTQNTAWGAQKKDWSTFFSAPKPAENQAPVATDPNHTPSPSTDSSSDSSAQLPSGPPESSDAAVIGTPVQIVPPMPNENVEFDLNDIQPFGDLTEESTKEFLSIKSERVRINFPTIEQITSENENNFQEKELPPSSDNNEEIYNLQDFEISNYQQFNNHNFDQFVQTPLSPPQFQVPIPYGFYPQAPPMHPLPHQMYPVNYAPNFPYSVPFYAPAPWPNY